MRATLILFIFPFFLVSQIKNSYKDERITCSYETTYGMLHGNYSSTYTNGKKKAEGNFKFNNRVGEWKTWDSTGKRTVTRIYQNSFSFQLLDGVYDKKEEVYKEGYRVYPTLDKKNILWEKRVWQVIKPQNNSILFSNDKLWNILYTALLNGLLVVYEDEDFRSALKPDVIHEKVNGRKMISLLVKEDVFWDDSRKLMDSRQIGICPVLANKKDTIHMGWIYFPSIRYKLALHQVEIPDFSFIKTLDDVFYFHVYAAEVEKEMNFLNISIKQGAKSTGELERQKHKVLVQIIETDHDFWLSGQ
jgi:antitoxin component YwqK of YwqJK toxin-antitoxin module